MNKLISGALLVIAVATLFAFSTTDASAQEKQKYSFKAPAGVTKYGEQHAIDVGDVPGHQLRVYETHSTYTGEAPVYDGVKVKEGWTRAVSDYTDGTGRGSGYGISILENGDKIFSRFELTTQTSVAADGSKTTKAYSVATLTGGTGKFKGIHGTLRGVTATDFKTLSGAETEGEYWIER
ncbi:MAG TPA: hypothetical protein VGU20_27880 [Stellaceae bacterium]|nr:hypothetical protein [Stellaceae bacterium]